MISNCNQILKWLNQLKHPVVSCLDRDLDSFNLSNFKLFKLYSFLNYILKKHKKSVEFFLFEEEYILVNKKTILDNKFYYNLKFDVFVSVKSKESRVIRSTTEDYRDSTQLQFDKNLILGGLQ